MHCLSYSDIAEVGVCRPQVISIGMFDGVHIGHRKILKALREMADRMSVMSSVWTFADLPPKINRLRLMHPALRNQRLADCGVDLLHEMSFTPAFARLEAEEFLDRVLIQALNVRGIILGEGAKLGQGRRTNGDEFLQMARERGLGGVLVEHHLLEGEKVSTSQIKKKIEAGEFEEARRLMKSPYRIVGEVVRDQGLGRQLGYPTANIEMGDFVCPPFGVYSARVWLDSSGMAEEGRGLKGILFIGTRPSIRGGGDRPVAEVHLPGWSGDLYGSMLCIEPRGFIREQRRFSGEEALKAQIGRDIASLG